MFVKRKSDGVNSNRTNEKKKLVIVILLVIVAVGMLACLVINAPKLSREERTAQLVVERLRDELGIFVRSQKSEGM